MLYLSTPQELDTAPLALNAGKPGKPSSFPKSVGTSGECCRSKSPACKRTSPRPAPACANRVSGQPIPINLIDLVIVPGIGFTNDGHRIGRGMGFYDRFLAQADFIGVSCGMGFEEQIVSEASGA